jgi:signal transduction histidine kinase
MKGKIYLLLFAFGFLLLASSCEPKKEDILTPKERMWLQSHPNIKIAVSTSFPPFQSMDENKNSNGLSVDFLKLLEKNIDYKFEKVYFDNWKKILKAGKNKEVDVILEIQETLDRKTYFHFTKPFLSIPHVIIMRKNQKDNISIDDLENLQVAVVDNYAVHEYLTVFYPELHIRAYPKDLSCLLALANQKVDAVITPQGYASYIIQKGLLINLQIVGDINYDNQVGFAIRKDWALLTRIMDKGLARITKKERQSILDYWVPIQALPFWKTTVFQIILLIVVAIAIFIAIGIYLWNQTLRKNVALKTLQLSKITAKAEESNRLKSSFLANMSHEIRTPLNAIQGFSELLSNKDLSTEKKKKFVKIINANCNSLTHLIDEILDLSKIESGLIDIQSEKVELVAFLEEITEQYASKLAYNKKIQILFCNELDQDKFEINTDPLRLTQILNNLINNAIKFTPQGKITIRLSYKGSSDLLFSVEDQGIGMDKSEIPIIFDRFTKIEKDASNLYRGSGLGLNICRKLLELMNGKIWVKSEKNTGSSFYFTLPIS